LNELATKSETLANKLFQIAFNTQNFIEKNNNNKNQNELTKKLRNLILSSNQATTSKSKNSTKMNPDLFDSFIKYYFRLVKIIHVDKPNENSDQLDDRSKINNFGRLSITFFQYLFNLFKVNNYFFHRIFIFNLTIIFLLEK
jgi:hypothetical protein